MGRTGRIALIGAKGMLASMVARTAPTGSELVLLDLPEFDLTDRAGVLERMQALRPAVIFNCAAYTDVDGCESREPLAAAVNGAGPGYLAQAALATGALLVHLSTDYVFDGNKTGPYREDDPTGPLSAYGRTKLQGETEIRTSGLTDYLIVRTSWLYGPGGKNFVDTMARLAAQHDELKVVADQRGCPTYTADLAAAIFALIGAGAAGVFHFSNEGECSWHEFAVEILAQLRARGREVRASRVLPLRTDEYPVAARRPANSVLSKDKYRGATGLAVPAWRESLAKYLGA